MKGILIVLIILVWLGALYYGYVLVISKSMRSEPETSEEVVESKKVQDKQRQQIEETMERQRQLMEDRQRTLRNHRNR